MKGTLVHSEEIAKGTSLFTFSLDEDIAFKSGQVFHIALREGLKHHFTILNSPNEKRMISFATRMRDSEFKNTLKALPLGAEVEIYKIKGEFVLPEDTSKPLVLIALGIGITPYVSMLRFIHEEHLPYHVTLIYSDSDVASMAFLEELKAYAKDNSNLKLILTVTKDPGWTEEKRHVDEQFIKEYVSNFMEPVYYISGAPMAVEAVSGSLVRLGIPTEQVKSENFTGY